MRRSLAAIVALMMLRLETIPVIAAMEMFRDFVSLLQQFVFILVPFTALSLFFLDLLDLLLAHPLIVASRCGRQLVPAALFLRCGHALIPALERESSLLCIHEIDGSIGQVNRLHVVV